jgi:hypothetical protein
MCANDDRAVWTVAPHFHNTTFRTVLPPAVVTAAVVVIALADHYRSAGTAHDDLRRSRQCSRQYRGRSRADHQMLHVRLLWISHVRVATPNALKCFG